MDSFTYCWSDKLTGKVYVGVHKGRVDDGYICSSEYMLEAYVERPEDFIREILFAGTYVDCWNFEQALIRGLFKSDPSTYYNRGQGGKFILTEEVRAKLIENHPMKREEVRRAVSEAHKGRAKSDEHLAKIVAASKSDRLRKFNSERMLGEKNPMYGKPSPQRCKPGTRLGAVVSEETKAKMRAAALARRNKV